MKVLFLNPAVDPHKKIMRDFDCAGESKGNYLYQPYDFLLMSGFVPRNWEFVFLDAVASKWTHAEVDEKVAASDPDVIVSSCAGINWKQDLETLKRLRRNHPKAKLLTFGDLFLDEYPRKEAEVFVDGILSSPVIFDFKHLEDKNFDFKNHEGFYGGQNWPLKNLKAAREIKVPLPRHEAFSHKAYRWPFAKHFHYTTITTAWGCPYSCSYCILNKFPNYWRDYRDVINEMKLVKTLGFHELYIGDKSFGLPLPNVMNLLDEMIRNNFNFSWSTYFHPNQYTPELLSKMKLAGCHTIIIGIESQNFEALKNYGRHVRKDQFKALLEHAHELGIEICGDFILGLPHDSKEGMLEMINFACTLNIQYASFNIATPLPGSSLRELAIETKKISIEDQHFDSSGHNIVLSLTDLSSQELKSLRELAVRRFYLRPRYLLQRLLKIRDWEHLMIQLDEGRELLKNI